METTHTREVVSRRYKGMAVAILALRNVMENRPDASAEELMNEFHSASAPYNVSEAQTIFIANAIQKYKERRRDIKHYRELYPDDAQFFTACFGIVPKGKIEV
ncbi:MAG: hypothetical protein HYV25_03075, partial [Candidatus Harrisonbacteria bacterium]|nr:hypothetical protein [Candidatus Harrisonbacteria bacterium]